MVARIGIVGIGWWATFNHIPVAQEAGAEIVAICDLDEERLRIAGDKFGISNRYTDLDEMLTAEKLDGLMVATPHVSHTLPAIKGLEAGCHVLIEKPMATKAEDGFAIASAGQKASREVLVPTGLSFTDWAIEAASLVRSGAIGPVRHVVAQMGSALDDLFSGNEMIETEDHLFRPPTSTWADPERAGGYGWGQLSHALSLLLYVTDLEFENIFARAGKSATGVDFYDTASAVATNGATISISGASTVPKHRGLQTDIRIFGELGMMAIDIERPRVEIAYLDGRDEIVEISKETADYDGALPVRRFVELCSGKAITNASNGLIGARSTAILDAMYKSMSSEKVETVMRG